MKKKFYFLALIAFLSFQYVSAQIAINMDGSVAASGSILHVKGSAGNHFYIDDATGFVGIGTLTPSELLHVNGAVRIGAYVLPAVDGSLGQVLTTNGSGVVSWSTVSGGGTADGDAWGVSGEDQSSDIGRTGAVGIGTNSPDAQLHIDGHVYQTGLGGSTFFGAFAGENDNLSSNNNTFIGYNSGASNTTGDENVALGYTALSNNVSGQQNVAIGAYSLWTNQTGSFNTAVGFNTLLEYLQLGGLGNPSERNTAIGYEAMKGSIVGFTTPSGERNTAVGYSALLNINSGNQNTTVGYSSMLENVSGSYNTAIGYAALDDNTSGTYNTALGFNAGPEDTHPNLTNTTAVGFNAHPSASNQIVLGDNNVNQVKTAGGITVGNTTVTEPGTIRWTGSHFEGWNGSSWVQLD